MAMAMGQKLSANGPKTSKPSISWCLMSIRAILGLCSTQKMRFTDLHLWLLWIQRDMTFPNMDPESLCFS